MKGAVVFDGVWKKFQRGEHHDSLRDLVPSLARRMFGGQRAGELSDREFWAVRDVSFEVREGEALGIVGPNGAGKSTILKLLTRILKPTKGRCAVHGRVGALIEVAAGFHPDLTGRENVFLQGAIIGMKRAEIARKFDQIVEFAGVGEFIDTPVKRFSSGMNARLGFAIAANLDPDVLIIDEVLSVGDSRFQARCIARMRELQARGVPLVFVSHNLPAVMELCTKAILMNRGQLVFAGEVGETVQRYRQVASAPPAPDARRKSEIWIKSVALLDEAGARADRFVSGGRLTVRIGYEAARPVEGPGFAVDIHRADGVHCFGIGMWSDGHDMGTVSGRGHVDLEIAALQLGPGFYNVSVGIHRRGGIGASGGIGAYDLHLLAYPFAVSSDRGDLGVVCLEHHWRSEPPPIRRAAAIKEVAVS
jgi:lipopolysaccharide transport system ATP-binding protein